MIGTTEKVKELNLFLDGLVSKIYTCQNDLLQNNIIPTVEAIKNRFTGSDEKTRMLVPIFELHNREVEKLVGKE